jgi:hypothetical protein
MEEVGWVAEEREEEEEMGMGEVEQEMVVGTAGSAGCRLGSTGGCCSPPRSS